MSEPFDASDSKQVQKSIKDSKSKAEVREEGLRQLLASQQGRAWLWGLLSDCDPYHTPFSQDALMTAFNCGRQDVGLKLIAEIHKVAAEQYLVMAKESTSA